MRVLVYRVGDLDTTMAELSAAGCAPSRTRHPAWATRAFRAPGAQRLAAYELTRRRADARLAGRHDFGPRSG
jgi:hypothetical protein